MAASPPHTVTLHVDICAALAPSTTLPPALQRYRPSFRFLLWNGHRATTDAVGEGGWDVMSAGPAAAPPTAQPSAAAAGKGTAKGGAAAPALAAAAAPSARESAAKGSLLRHRTSLSGLRMDLAAAQALGQRPVVYLFCMLREEEGGSGAAAPQAAAKGAKGAPAAAAPAAAAPGSALPPSARPYAFCVPLDASPLLLEGRASVCAAHGSRAAGEGALALDLPADAPPTSLFSVLGLAEPVEPFLPPPALFSFLTFSIAVAQASVPSAAAPLPTPLPAAAAPAAAATPAPKGGKPAAAAAAAAATPPPAAAAAAPLAILPPTLLSPSIRAALNPLAITLLAATGMPGAPHLTQHAHCQPAYAQLELPVFPRAAAAAAAEAEAAAEATATVTLPDATPLPAATSASSPSTSSLSKDTLAEAHLGLPVAYPPPRLLITPALLANSSLHFGTTWVACIGGAEEAWKEFMETSALVVRVHDRDVRSVALLCEKARETLRAAQGSKGGAEAAEAAAAEAAAAAAATAAAAAAAAAAAPVTSGKKDSAKGSASAGAGAGASSSSAAPPAPQPPVCISYAELRAQILPPAWAWPLLPNPRTALYHDMALGAVPWPKLQSGEPLPSCVPGAALFPAATAAPGAASAPPPSAKGAAASAAPATAAAPHSASKPDLFDCDSLYIAELTARCHAAPHMHSHATASLRLDGLLNPALAPCTIVKVSAPLLPTQRLSRSRASEPVHLLSRAELALATPGAYAASDAQVKVRLALSAALPPAPAGGFGLNTVSSAGALRAASLAAGGCEVDTHYSASAPMAAARADAALAAALAGSGAGCFERMVLVCSAGDDALVLRLVTAITAINSRCLRSRSAPGSGTDSAPESLRAFTLPPALLADVAEGRADVITGVQVLDSARRVFLLEGLGGGARGAEELRRALPPRPDPADPTWSLLSNPALRFSRRLYASSASGLVLRDIRLAAPLAATAQHPSVYRRDATSAALEQAVTALCVLAQASVQSLAGARLMEAHSWPCWEGLLELERKMGSAVGLVDTYGRLHPAAAAEAETALRLQESSGLVEAQRGGALQREGRVPEFLHATLQGSALQAAAQHSSSSALVDAALQGSSRTGSRRTLRGVGAAAFVEPPSASPATLAYLDTLRQPLAVLQAPGALHRAASPIDFQQRNRASVAAGSTAVAAARQEAGAALAATARAAAMPPAPLSDAASPPPDAPAPIFLYSSQRLNTGDAARQAQRARLAACKSATFTRSQQLAYGALHLSLDPDREEVAREEAARERAARVTARGFVYPTGSTRAEDLVHPKRDNASAFLREAYVEGAVAQAVEEAGARAAAAAVGARARYDANANPSPLGHRGTGHRDPLTGAGTFGHSALLNTGGSSSADALAAAAAEAQAWRAALVTDTPHFAFHASKDHTRSERARSLLRGEARKPSLQTLQAGRPAGQGAHPGSGVAVPPLAHPPVSMFATGEAFPGPSPPLQALLRPLPAAPRDLGTPWGGTSAQLERGAFSSPGRDFQGPREPDIVTGLAARVHVPLLEAARRTNAEPGVRNFKYIAPHVAGVNTDGAQQ